MDQSSNASTEVHLDSSRPAVAEIDLLREQLTLLTEEKKQWLEERARLVEENEILTKRCQKLARGQRDLEDAAVQTDSADSLLQDSQTTGTDASGRLPPFVEQMLKNPRDEAAQLQGIEALLAQQTHVDDSQSATSTAFLQGALEAAVAIFSNHPTNHNLLLKVSQYLSVLLAEPGAQQQLPLAMLFTAAQNVVSISSQLLPDGLAAPVKAGMPKASKLLTWFISVLALLLPCLSGHLRNRQQGETFVHDLLFKVVSQLLSSAELPQEALVLKCTQLLPLLPMETWIQKVCLESGAVHSLALAYHRCMGSPERGENPDTALLKAVRAAVRRVFSDNLELCARALADTFVSDEFVCREVLDELCSMESKQRGAFRLLDSDWGITTKAMGLWAFHQRRVLEDADPQKSASREVLPKVAHLLTAVFLKLPPQVLLQRMKEFQSTEVLQRIALAAIHTNGQLRLQIAVNYVENGAVPVFIECLQMLLHRYEGSAPAVCAPALDVGAAFRLLQDKNLPEEGWPYILYCLEVCLHILSHWSATRFSLRQKADALDSRAAPLLLAQGGLVDVLAELIEPAAAGFELHTQPPQQVADKAKETLQALFEQNGHICLFCMQHYTEVKQMVALGCESLARDPLTDFPDMQQQAVGQLSASFDKFSVKDERIGRKILHTLAVLFESSYQLVEWYLKNHKLTALGEYQSLDLHLEAVRAVSRTPYWSSEDAVILPLVAQLLLSSVEGHNDDPSKSQRLVLDLTEAEDMAAACMSALLHLLLLDPAPPTALHCLADCLSQSDGQTPESSSEKSSQAVTAVMRVMQVFPSSERIQMNCQHLLNSLLGE